MPRSKLEATLDAVLRKLFPNDVIVCDYPIKIGRSTLYVDRVIQDKRIAFEADGLQHQTFVEHFHRDAQGFKDSKTRDQIKERWLEQNGFTLVRISHYEKITVGTVRKKLLSSLR